MPLGSQEEERVVTVAMTSYQALSKLVEAGGRLKYHGSGFGDAIRASLCRGDLIHMEGGFMALTPMGRIVHRSAAGKMAPRGRKP